MNGLLVVPCGLLGAATGLVETSCGGGADLEVGVPSECHGWAIRESRKKLGPA